MLINKLSEFNPDLTSYSGVKKKQNRAYKRDLPTQKTYHQSIINHDKSRYK